MKRRKFLSTTAAASLAPSLGATDGDPLVVSIESRVLLGNRDGSAGTTWFHPRGCRIPGSAGDERAFFCLQPIGGSDYFGPVHWMETSDLGRTWTDPASVPPLGRIPVPDHPGLEAGVCDVVPGYHPSSDTILCLGHVVFYRGPKFSKGDQLARYPVYAVRRADGTWSERKILEWDDPRGSFIYSNNCGQRVVTPEGDILHAFTFGSRSEGRLVAGVRSTFDGETLRVADVGPPLENPTGRGLLEPSVTRFGDHYYMTIRAEDDRGYVARSSDGIHYDEKQAWAWEDGEPLVMSTTQQHWMTHSDGLFLVYTRKDESNAEVIRWRSPLWMAQVDPATMRLQRETEQVVIPLSGDGLEAPDDVPLMGNFDVTPVSPDESWVTVGSWLPRREARGDLHLARIRWSRPNRLVTG